MKTGRRPHTKKTESAAAILEAGRLSLGASSCTFWVRDPWWPDQFVQVFMPGVKITEPMHGFVLPMSSYHKVAGPNGGTETYFRDSVRATELRDDLGPELERLVEENPIFGDFVRRENVRSCARFRHFSADKEADAVMWINFTEQRLRFEKQKMRTLMDAMVECLPTVMKRLRTDSPFPSSELVQVLKPAEHLASIGHPSDLESYLNEILDALLNAFNLKEEMGLGTIHMFDSKKQVLRRIAYRGVMDAYAPVEQDVRGGEGVITWVGLKRRAILIPDLETSPFRQIHKRIASDVVNELAVPMLAGDELLGVLNLESKVRPSPFSTHSVRTIWYAASQAAIACRLYQHADIAHQQTERTSRLLEIAHKAVLPPSASKPLFELANLARDWLRAAECDIWQYNERIAEFTDSGASYRHHPTTPPRENGWSHYVRVTRTPVWFSNVTGLSEFAYMFWDRANQTWNSSPPKPDVPKTVNERLVAMEVRCELGIPIQVGDRCIGVAWLKYVDEQTPAPGKAEMSLADGFAAQASLVIDVLQRSEESALMEQGFREYRDTLFPTGAFEVPGIIDGYVIRKPSGEVGGDFHAYHVIDGKRACFLVGDAEGHGTMGALRMLPMITTFGVFAGESCSTKHTLWRLLPVCDRWQLRGTAICFIIDTSSQKPVIFGSSAGHHSLIIVNEQGLARVFPDENGVANRGALGAPLDLPIGEESYELSHGDLIIAYTDGVLEPGGRFAEGGRKAIVEAVLPNFDRTPEDIARAIEEKTLSQAEGLLQDDATIMVLRVR